MDLPGADNGAPRVLKGPNDTTVNVTCGTAPYVCSGGMGYDLWAGKFKEGNGSNPSVYPYSEQSDAFWAAENVRAATRPFFGSS